MTSTVSAKRQIAMVTSAFAALALARGRRRRCCCCWATAWIRRSPSPRTGTRWPCRSRARRGGTPPPPTRAATGPNGRRPNRGGRRPSDRSRRRRGPNPPVPGSAGTRRCPRRGLRHADGAVPVEQPPVVQPVIVGTHAARHLGRVAHQLPRRERRSVAADVRKNHPVGRFQSRYPRLDRGKVDTADRRGTGTGQKDGKSRHEARDQGVSHRISL